MTFVASPALKKTSYGDAKSTPKNTELFKDVGMSGNTGYKYHD
jgi:hypothetical protein